MIFSIITYILAAVGLFGIYLVAGGGLDRAARVPDVIEKRGPFELVTHTRRDEYYSIRYNGKPFPIVGRAGMYGDETATYSTVNALITFDEGGPAFVVHVGDPNNTGFFYLIREKDGTAHAEYLAEARSGVSAGWIDPSEGTPSGGNERDVALHRGAFTGGRWLLLGDQCVLDTKNLTAYTFELPQNYSFNPFRGPLGISPDEKSFVRLASASGDTQYLVVVPFAGGESYALPIDSRTMRYQEFEEIDTAWVRHHFEWRPMDGALQRLIVRERFTPLPYRGRLNVDRSAGSREYRLPKSSRALHTAMVDFAVQKLGATRGTDTGDETSVQLALAGKPFQISYYTDYASVYAPFGESSRPVLLFARGFDEELKTGRYDAMFQDALPASDSADGRSHASGEDVRDEVGDDTPVNAGDDTGVDLRHGTGKSDSTDGTPAP